MKAVELIGDLFQKAAESEVLTICAGCGFFRIFSCEGLNELLDLSE